MMMQHDEAAEPTEGALSPEEVTELQASLTPRLVELLGKLLPDASGVLAEYGGINPDPFDDPGQGAMNGEMQGPGPDDMPMPGGAPTMRPPVPVAPSPQAMPAQPPPMMPPGPAGQPMPLAPQTGLNRIRMMGAR